MELVKRIYKITVAFQFFNWLEFNVNLFDWVSGILVCT